MSSNFASFENLIELSITQFSEFFNLKLIEKFTGFGGKFSLFELKNTSIFWWTIRTIR